MPHAASGGASSGGAGPQFSYSGVDPATARHIFESLFGGAAGGGLFGGPFGGSSINNMRSSGSSDIRGGPQFQFFSSGPGTGGSFRFAGAPVGASRGDGSSSDDDMFEAGAAGADPFGAFGMGDTAAGMSGLHGSANPFLQQQQHSAGGSRKRPGSTDPHYGGFQNQQQQPLVQQVQLLLTLEELYKGVTKRLKVTRHMMDAASGKSLPVQEVLEVQVRCWLLLHRSWFSGWFTGGAAANEAMRACQ